ncbi:MAG: DUF2142 domain-containing protein [Oscillatoriales cyanobacterium]|nr:MAG: DUF2142 domain-containing protein [Oscillatoriales cyanobacterium]
MVFNARYIQPRRPSSLRPVDAIEILQRWFVVIAAISCLAVALITPPFQAADEYLHFYRAYQVSTGQLIPDRKTGPCSGYSTDFAQDLCLGGALPRSLLTTVRQASAEDLRFDATQKQDFASWRRLWSLPLNPDDRHFLKFNTTGLHAPIGYVPQAFGIAIGRSLDHLPGFPTLPPIALMYCGRLANGIAWLGLINLAIQLAPEFTLAWFAIGLLPMAIFQASSLSADVLTNGLACVIVALVMRYRSKSWESSLMPWLLSILTALFAISKLAYAPMALLLSLIPARSFFPLCTRPHCPSCRWLWLGVTGFLSVASVFAWSQIVDQIYVSLHPGLDPAAQIAGMLSDPLGFLLLTIVTLTENASRYLQQFIGVFGWLDTPLPLIHVLGYTIALIIALLSGQTHGELRGRLLSPWRKRDRGIAIVAMVSSIGLLCGLAYLWNLVGADRIGGLQGRYFIPLAPLLLPILGPPRSVVRLQSLTTASIGLAILSGVSTVTTLIQRYYAISG